MLIELVALVVVLGLPALIVGGLIWAYIGERRRERDRQPSRAGQWAPDASIEEVGVTLPRDGAKDRGPITGLSPGDQPSVGGF